MVAALAMISAGQDSSAISGDTKGGSAKRRRGGMPYRRPAAAAAISHRTAAPGEGRREPRSDRRRGRPRSPRTTDRMPTTSPRPGTSGDSADKAAGINLVAVIVFEAVGQDLERLDLEPGIGDGAIVVDSDLRLDRLVMLVPICRRSSTRSSV